MPGLYQPGHLRPRRHDRRRRRGGRGAARRRDRAGRRAAGLRLDRTAHQRLHAGAPDRLRPDEARPRRPARRHRPHRRRRAARGAPELLRRACGPSSAGCTGWRTSPAAASPATWCGSCPTGCEAVVDPASLGAAAAVRRCCSRREQISTEEMRDVFNLGVGLIAVLPADAVAAAQAAAAARRGRHLDDGRDPPRQHRRAVRPSLTEPAPRDRTTDAMASAPRARLAGLGPRAAQSARRRGGPGRRRGRGRGVARRVSASARRADGARGGRRAGPRCHHGGARSSRAITRASSRRAPMRCSPPGCGAWSRPCADPESGGAAAAPRGSAPAGVEVELGLLADEAAAQNADLPPRAARPLATLVALKLATTIDGRIADANGHSRWLSAPAGARLRAMAPRGIRRRRRRRA